MKIELKGIKRNTPGVISEDGELEELVNLRYKDGAFRPIPNRSVVLPDLDYDDIYIHSNSGYKHYLGVHADKLYYFAQDIDFAAEKQTEQFICDISGEVTFTQMGNVINILDSQGIKYAIWYDDDYKLIDSNFDGLQTSEELIGKVDLKVDLNTITRKYISSVSYPTGRTTDELKLKTDGYLGLYNKALAGLKEDGLLSGFFLACTAIELYDGSYIMHSNPILLGQAADAQTRYNVTIGTSALKYSSGSVVVSDPFRTKVYDSGKEYNSVSNSFQQYIDNVTGGRNAIFGEARVSGGASGAANAELLMPNLIGFGPDANSKMSVYAHSNKLKFKLNTKLDTKYNSLIKSISVFISQEVGLTKDTAKYVGYATNTQELIYENYYGELKTDADIKKEIGELSTFYKIYEIPFDDAAIGSTFTAGTWVEIDLKDKLSNLTAQEVLTYDNFSHHQLLPEVQFMYNSKLHLGDMKTFLSRGFPLWNFFIEQGVGQFGSNSGAVGGIGYWIEVSIKTSNGLTKVVRYKDRVLGSFNASDMSSFVSYPDARATRMVIHLEIYSIMASQWTTRDYDLKLAAHTTQNLAYYISDDLNPQQKIWGLNPPAFTHPTEVQREQINSNVCRVSEINNPFVFPVENTYSIGNGQIKAFSTNTIELSVGQAGQFPLYIFTSDGIYALFIGGSEVNYASSRPISREVINNKNVKPVDNGVIFTTDKGVMIISGSQVQDLSEVLRGDYLDISNQTTFQKTKSGLTMLQEVVANDKLVQLSTAITTENVLKFIKNAVIGYKYIDKEIWFTNPDKDYSYIFSKGIWTKITQTGIRFINDYPRQLILNGSNLVDIAGETPGDVQTMFITRPLKMGDGFKQMITAVVRGDFKTNVTLQHHAGIYIFGSYDGKRWNFLGGHESKGELKDLGAKVERTDCKYFRIAFVGNISTDSTINYIEIEGKESLLNSKMR